MAENLTPGGPIDVLMVGHFARDSLVVDGRAETAAGGAVHYGSIALRRLGLRVAVATRLHPDDFDLLCEMKEAGVEVHAAEADQTSGIKNVYDSRDMERRTCTLLGFAGPFRLQDIPDIRPRILSVSPIIAGEVDLPLLRKLHGRAPLALDIQGFVRVCSGHRKGAGLDFRPWDRMEEGLELVTYLKTDRAEAELVTGQSDLAAAARTLASLGPSEVVITESSGVTVWADETLHRAPFTPRSLAGRTGRGDTCFATYLTQRLHKAPEEALKYAAALTSLKMETPGPFKGSIKDVEALLGTY